MAGFPPARGGGNAFLGLIGGLGSLVNGFAQGRQLRDQEQMNQQSIQNQKLGNALSVFQMLGQIGEADPDALKSPQFSQFAQNNLGQAGIPLPRDAQGNIDVNVFRKPLNALTQNEGLFSQFNQYEPGSQQRQQMLAGFGGTDEEKQGLLNAPRVYTPAEQDSAATTLRYLTNLAATGTVDPNSPTFVAQYNAAAKVAGRPEWQGVQMGAKTVAGIQHTQSGTNLNNQRAQWIAPLAQSSIAANTSKSNYYDAQGAAIPVKLAQAWQGLSIRQQQADTAFGNLQARIKQLAISAQNADTNAGKLALQIYSDSSRQLQTDQQLREKYVGMLAAFNQANAQTPGYDPSTNVSAKSMQAQIDALNKRIGTEQQFIQGHPKLQQAIRTKQIRKAGAPSNMQAVKQPASGPAVLKKGNVTLYRQPDGSYSDQKP